MNTGISMIPNNLPSRFCFFSCRPTQCLRQEKCSDREAQWTRRGEGNPMTLNETTRRAMEANTK